MKKIYLTPVVFAVVALLGACSSAPTVTSLLEQTRQDYRAAQSSSGVASYAALELKQAGEALGQADAAASHKESAEKVDKLAYLAKQKIALTQEVAKQKSAEAEVAGAAKVRDQMRLDQRTNEANLANASAEQSKLAAQTAQQQATAAQQQAAAAQRSSREAQDQAAQSQLKTQEAQARATQLEAQLADLAAKQTTRGIVITLGDVLFGTDLARLNATGLRTAQKLANVLQTNPGRSVLIEGFTDSTGSASHNQELSERRAEAVRAALLELGVDRSRVAMRGYGQSYPVAGNDSAADRQLNRRVEIILSDDSGNIAAR